MPPDSFDPFFSMDYMWRHLSLPASLEILLDERQRGFLNHVQASPGLYRYVHTRVWCTMDDMIDDRLRTLPSSVCVELEFVFHVYRSTHEASLHLYYRVFLQICHFSSLLSYAEKWQI